MYSLEVIDRTLHQLKLKSPDQHALLTRRPIEDSIAIRERLETLIHPDNTSITNPQFTRPLTPEEQHFIFSERFLCRLDFRYWAERYGYCERDAGASVGPAKFWPSQEIALDMIGARELENYHHQQQYGMSDRINVVWNKSRQQGATSIARLIIWHRMTTKKDFRAISASLDEKRMFDMYTRDKRILDNLPFYLSHETKFDVKSEQIELLDFRSRVSYQQANQEKGIGTGQNFNAAHLTEVALWDNPYRIEFDLFPAVPEVGTSFFGMESTANGRGDFWHTFTEAVRKRESGYGSWIYVFTPWYINSQKNRRIPPDGYTPSPKALEMIDMVTATSAEYANQTITLTLPQIYWWDDEYARYKSNGSLATFYTNYPSTPEQSFQHTTHSAFPVDTIDWMRTMCRPGIPYTIEARTA